MKKIALDIGHGLRSKNGVVDMGAVSVQGLSEYGFWLTHGPLVAGELERLGHDVRIFKRSDHGGIAAECRAINSWGADCAVSLHLNSADNVRAAGHEVVYHAGSVRGKALAEYVNAGIGTALGNADRGIRIPYMGRGDAFLAGTKAPAIITESIFLSNPQDEALLLARAGELCVGIAYGIDRWLNRRE